MAFRNTILNVLLVLLCGSCGSASSQDHATARKGLNHQFAGVWYWKSTDGKQSFKIILREVKDSLYGQYCAVYDSGNRLDCDFDSVTNIQGRIATGIANVKFFSFFGGTNGEARMNAKDGKLIWKIIQYPQGGDCFAPQDAELSLEKLW